MEGEQTTEEAPRETTEQWVVGHHLATALNCLNAINQHPNYRANVARIVSEECGAFAIEDGIDVLNDACDIVLKRKRAMEHERPAGAADAKGNDAKSIETPEAGEGRNDSGSQ